MENQEFVKLFSKGSDALYNEEETASILKAFNEAIHGLYTIGSEESYIFDTLDTTTYVQEEYKKLTENTGTDLIDIANKLEMMRNVLFGDCFNWDNIYAKLNKIHSKK